ncbi:MAG: hypothetical protein KC656_05395 [Myxococcales bacterium]|nr:hypothetical protein [Myxococcales bacterium]MCB9669941.1 hypothetical protein [Alphaproteobacteria bacterium]MCB9693185.1 hypothetical protein [Alphaproteobacteria bacterium]
MRLFVGHSDDPEASEAIQEAIGSLEGALDGARPIAAVVYAAIDMDHQAIVDGIAESAGRTSR